MSINTTHPDLAEYQRQITTANTLLYAAAEQIPSDAALSTARAHAHATLALAAATAATVPAADES